MVERWTHLNPIEDTNGDGAGDAVAVSPVNEGGSIGTVTSVGDDAASVTLLAANAGRKGAIIRNTSSAVLNLHLRASAATVATAQVALASGASYEIPFGYKGEIRGIWTTDPGDGQANIVEFT
jgi:hypothetical protein